MKPGVTRLDNAPYPGAYLRPLRTPFNGGGGLVPSTFARHGGLIRSLRRRPHPAHARNIAAEITNQLPYGQWNRFCHDRANSRQGLRAGGPELIVNPRR